MNCHPLSNLAWDDRYPTTTVLLASFPGPSIEEGDQPLSGLRMMLLF